MATATALPTLQAQRVAAPNPVPSVESPQPYVRAYQWSPYNQANSRSPQPLKASLSPMLPVEVPRRFFATEARLSRVTRMLTSPPQAHVPMPVFSPHPMRKTSIALTAASLASVNGLSDASIHTTPPADWLTSPSESSLHTPENPASPLNLPMTSVLGTTPTSVAPPSLSPADLVRVVLAQPSDAMVAAKVHQLDEDELTAVFHHLLEENTVLIEHVLMKQRGNLVSQLFTTPHVDKFPTELQRLFEHLAGMYVRVAHDKLGALALTRLYDSLPKDSQYRHAMDGLTLLHLDPLVHHRYGNFIVSQLVKNISTSSRTTFDGVVARFANPESFVGIALDKFGSHTAEVWAMHAPASHFALTVRRLLEAQGALWLLADSLTGNNPLQRLVHRMYQSRSSGVTTPVAPALACLWEDTHASIIEQVKGAHFSRLIRAAVFGNSPRSH